MLFSTFNRDYCIILFRLHNMFTNKTKNKFVRRLFFFIEIFYWVNMLLVDKFSSTGIWSTDYCRKIFVDTTLRRHSTSSTSILSKFFRRHDISSTQHFVDKHFVDTTLRRIFFVDTITQKSNSSYEF